MLTRAIMMVLVIANALSSRAIGQCDDLRSASVEQATSFIERAPDDAASAKCVQIAFDLIGSLPTEQAVPVLLKYLGYKRPLNDGERLGIFKHGDGPGTLYPALHELVHLGSASEPGVIRFIGESKDASRTVLDNAIHALVLIHHGDGLAVVQKLHSESGIAVDPDASRRLQSAAKDATKWCDERWGEKCADALAN
jgi:hypothetical protein